MPIITIRQAHAIIDAIVDDFFVGVSKLAEAKSEARIASSLRKLITAVEKKTGISLLQAQEFPLGDDRMDLIYRNAVVECKSPGTLTQRFYFSDKAVSQMENALRQRAEGKQHTRGEVGILFDGRSYVFGILEDDEFIFDGPVDVTKDSTKRFLFLLFFGGSDQVTSFILNRLSSRYFRSLYDVELGLKPLTIIIGPNASGKSNLFKAMHFLYDAVAADIQIWQAHDVQSKEAIWFGYDEYNKRPAGFLFSLTFGNWDGSEALSTYDSHFDVNQYMNVAYESLKIKEDIGQINLVPYMIRKEKHLQFLFGKRGRHLKQPIRLQTRSPRTLSLRDEGLGFTLPLAQAVYQYISGWRFFDPNLTFARQAAFVPVYPEKVPPLANDASNLSAFLYALSQLRADDFTTIVETLEEYIDLPQGLIVSHDEPQGGRTARYEFIEKPFGEERPLRPESMSDGTIRLLSLLALLLGDRSVTVACLEEPDHGLHPRLMHYLADSIRQVISPPSLANADVFPGPQVIITTHSPEFMDCFDLEEEKEYLQVLIAERDEDGKTVFVPASAEEFAPWLERYRLGEAVRRHFV